MADQAVAGAGDNPHVRTLDALVIGAGVGGLYQLYQLREKGLSVASVEAAADVGGTWHWNRYPGARFDSEGYIYQYLFDETLFKDWTWSERFPSQPEIERWMHYIADRLDLRKDIDFGRTVKSAHFDEVTSRWRVETDAGHVYDTQFLVACSGVLSAPLEHLFEGEDTFRGDILHTARWPAEGLDLAGKRVGIIGTGATGIQVIQTIAPEVAELKVFVRTPQYVLPMKNPKYGPAEVRAYKDRFEELRDSLFTTFTGFEYDFEVAWDDLTPAQRTERLEDLYGHGSLKMWLAGFGEVFFYEEISEEVSEFVRDKMRARLKDPELIETLVPTEYGFGTRRVPLETGYLETYHRDNVHAINIRKNGIAEIVPYGIRMQDGTVHELDVIILAVGFDGSTGALTRIDVRGRGGRSLSEDWAREVRTTMGLQKHGYPNLFLTGAPLAPSAALCNVPTCLQQQTEWITACIGNVIASGKSTIEPLQQTEDDWVAHHDETASATLIGKTDSWWVGSNVEGKPRRVLAYTGGAGAYNDKCKEVAESGYAGFEMA
ncbi:MAG: NAD(P)/FAD-dependent oxidoreductase [Phyllobacteriaceae bacterium]|jgi:cyclohexanone monooxygenase/acetone monooxygenase|nr:NAD(P)/FAD-dependent oxidoreductase [Phyllobacteriaceae bacterium]